MSPVFRDRDKSNGRSDPLRMVLDDETVARLQTAAATYGLEVEELMVALLQAGAERVRDLLGEPPTSRQAN